MLAVTQLRGQPLGTLRYLRARSTIERGQFEAEAFAEVAIAGLTVLGGLGLVILAGELERDVQLVEPADGIEEAVGAGYRSKYRAHGEYVRDMLAPLARSTKRELLPI